MVALFVCFGSWALKKHSQSSIKDIAICRKKLCKFGIIDDLAKNEEELLAKAKAWLLKAKEGRRKWDTETGKIPFGSANHPENRVKIQRLAASVVKRFRGNFRASQAILNTLVEGSLVNFDTALQIERRYFTELVSNQQTQEHD